MPVTTTIAPAADALDQSASGPQHLQALARANRVRRARAALKRAVASDERCAAEVILECPWEAESMPISELLSAQRRWGITRTRKFLLPLEMSENKHVGTLTPRQRMLLASGLRAKAREVAPPQLVAAPAAA